MKYKLTKNTKKVNGITLYQVQALKDFGNVKKGDIGGWIEKEENLSQEGGCWVFGNAWVFGDTRVYGNAWVSDNAWVYGDAEVSGNAWVSDNARKKTPLYIQGTKHSLTNSKHGHITIGCKTETIDWWLSEEAERFARGNGYTFGDIQEYKEYVNLIKKVGF